MASNQPYPTETNTLGQYLLMLRSRAKLTQAELAARLGIHRRSIQKWESHETYPTAENLRALLLLLLDLRVFIAGQERTEAAALWQIASQTNPQRLEAFDPVWFEEALAARTPPTTQDPTALHRPLRAIPPSTAERPQTAQHRNPARGLPFQPTPLIGRTIELREIGGLLADRNCRLLTLLGPGGIGKTRLAVAVAEGQSDTFSDGIAFVPLAAVTTPHQMITAIGDALKLTLQTNPMAHLLSYLRPRHSLLLLDNFEHLIDSTDLVSAILTHAPRVTILVTSRVRLNLQAEWLFDVGGLTYPPVPAQSIAELSTYSAIQLFMQRVAQLQAGSPPPEATLLTIAHICQHVAGIPLAIELAAAATRLLPVTMIEQEIRSNLDLLATTLRDVPPRHRSLRAVFDQSWHLLSGLEQAIFCRLALFRGGWTPAAAEQVAGATLPLLAALVDKSLVYTALPATGTQGVPVSGPRFALLEPLREYALEKLLNREEAPAIQRAHATYYLTLAETVATQWDRPTADAAIAQLDRDYDNLRAALQWVCKGGDVVLGLQLAGTLRRFWQRRGLYSEGRTWLAELLTLDTNPNDPVVIATRAQALHTAAWLASDQHDFTQAAPLFEQSMVLRRTLGQTTNETHLLAPAARQARAVGQYTRATELLEEALARQRAQGDHGSASTGGIGQSFYDLALMLREQGDFARATALFEEGLAFHRTLGEQEGIAIGLMGLGDVARDQGDAEQLRTYSEQSLAITRALGIQWAIGFALNNLALAAYLTGDLTRAVALVGESIALFREMKNDGGLAEVLLTLGLISQAQGNLTAAHAALTEALGFAKVVGPRLMVATTLEALAAVIEQTGEATQSVRLLAAASTLREQMGTPVRPVDQPAVTHTLTNAHTILGAETFAIIWAAAEAIPLEEILHP